MATKPISPEEVVDGFYAFNSGVNTGWLPSILEPTQLANGVNLTVRGGFPITRPPIRKRLLDFGGDTVLERLFVTGRFQGACYYKPDSGTEQIVASIGGHLFAIVIGSNSYVVRNISISNATVTSAPFTVPALNGVVAVSVASTTNIFANTNILIGTHNYLVVSIDSPTQLTVQNLDDTPTDTITGGAILTFFDLNPAHLEQAWLWQSEKWVIVNDGESLPIFYDGATSRRSQGITGGELGAGKMGVYWLGRNWWVNPDGRTFRAGDIVYSSSGTAAEHKRDAVLKQTQNTFLATGGDFTVPSNAGEITAMAVVNILDVSLGQGPLQVLTPNMIFGCTAPVDNLDWQATTNPILSVSQISYGGTSQYGTILVNGDMIYRSLDGIRSLVIGRRDVVTWGNTPISHEMQRYLVTDDPTLLRFASGLFFDNRVLFTTAPRYSQHGVYHQGLVALNADVLSGINGKKPSVWDGLWTSVNTLQMVKGIFNGVERAFLFSFQTTTKEIELYELLPTGSTEIYDNNGQDQPVPMAFETPTMFRKTGIGEYARIRLVDGELYVDDVQGLVNFRILFRPDQYPCWIPWKRFRICAERRSCPVDPAGCMTIEEVKPQYRVEIGFGEPPLDCDPITNKPYRVGYTFDFRIEAQGHVRIGGAKFKAVREDNPQFAAVADCD